MSITLLFGCTIAKKNRRQIQGTKEQGNADENQSSYRQGQYVNCGCCHKSVKQNLYS